MSDDRRIASVADALRAGREMGLDRLDSTVLLSLVLQRDRTWLLAHDDAPLDQADAAAWRNVARRRAAGEPLAYIVGRKEFYGLSIAVDPAVLIPRPDTELLVDIAIEVIDGLEGDAPRIVDLGTGSGAIALACKSVRGGASVFASDVSDAALDVARRNACRLHLDVTFRQGSWWEPWTDMRFDVAVCNPPYVAEGDPHLAALCHEPAAALIAGARGMAHLRTVVLGAPAHLSPSGQLWVEHGFEQAGLVRQLLATAGFAGITTRCDLGGRPRCSGGILSAGATPSPTGEPPSNA